MSLSGDSEARRRQLANLNQGPSDDAEIRARQIAGLEPGGIDPSGRPDQPNLQHGGYAEVANERLDAKALEMTRALAADAPLKYEGELPAADAAVVRLAAECLVRLDDVAANVRDFGVFIQRGKRKGEVRPAVELEGRLRREALGYLEQLGMTPAARAKLGVDLVRARDLAQEMSGLDRDGEGADG